jgi:hypothetical protein
VLYFPWPHALQLCRPDRGDLQFKSTQQAHQQTRPVENFVNRQNLREYINPQQNTPIINFPNVAQFPSAIDILKVEAMNQGRPSQAAFLFPEYPVWVGDSSPAPLNFILSAVEPHLHSGFRGWIRHSQALHPPQFCNLHSENLQSSKATYDN